MLTSDRLIRLCRARDLLRDADAPEDYVAEVAAAVAMSPYHFIRQFKAVFGESPGQFRTRARLERAKRLLARGDQSVTDVCMDVGFVSLGSFSALFSKRFGESPAAFRARLRVSPTPLQPHCLDLLRGAWTSKEQ